MPLHQQRIAQIARQGGKPSIAECRYRMKSRKRQLFVHIHPHCTMNIAPDGKRTYPLYHQCKAKDIHQCGQQGIQRIGTDHIAHHQLIIQRGIPHEEHREETCQRHHPQTANLNQQNDDYKTRCRESGCHVYRSQSRHTHRTGGNKQRIHPRDARHRRTGKHQQPCPYEYDNEETDRQDKRRVCPSPQQPYQPIRQIQERQHQQQYKMIGLAVQKIPDCLHGAFHFRAMKDNRNQRQIKQKSQYPGQHTESLPRIFILQQDM